MVSIKRNDILIFFALIMFFASQIVSGWLQIICLGIMAILFITSVVNKVSNIWVVLFLVLLFQKAFQRITDGAIYQAITYMDEVVEVALACYLFYAMFKYRLSLTRWKKVILVSYIIYVLICTISTLNNTYVTPLVAVLDCFVCSKFIIFYCGGMELSRQRIFDGKKMLRFLNTPCKMVSIILLLLCIHDLFFPAFFEKFDFRYFTYSLQLCFQHPTYLAAVCVTCMAVLIYNMQNDKHNLKYIFIFSIVTLLTFRTKAIAAIFVIIVIYFIYIRYKLPFKGLLLVAGACVAIFFGLDALEVYFTEGTSVPIRLKMMRDGISIAQSHFPLGAGFGTFGTGVAYDNGSPFYYNLGYMSGFYANQPVSDVFWPGVFAEGGWIGTIFFAICVTYMVFEALNRIKTSPYAGWCMLSILVYAFIASTSETAFFNPATAFMFIIYGIAADKTAEQVEAV